MFFIAESSCKHVGIAAGCRVDHRDPAVALFTANKGGIHEKYIDLD
jgi:hypothetical protein